jgi:hypothetical protein
MRHMKADNSAKIKHWMLLKHAWNEFDIKNLITYLLWAKVCILNEYRQILRLSKSSPLARIHTNGIQTPLEQPQNVMYVVFIRSRLGSKNICDHPYKKTQKAPKIPPKGPFLTFCMGDCKSPCDQRKIERKVDRMERWLNVEIYAGRSLGQVVEFTEQFVVKPILPSLFWW